MRCKNCGCENDDNLFICQNCGSPLYEEDEALPVDNNDNTKVFSTNEINNAVNGTDSDDEADEAEKKKAKQSVAIIIILAVVLVAIVTGIVVKAVSGGKEEPSSEIETSESAESTSESANENPSTTASTTTTTTTTTEAPTEAEKLMVSLSCNAGGEVEGDGKYALGDNATIIARPDDGYEFAGWYQGNTKVSGQTKYKFTVTEDVSLKAVFILVQIEDAPSEPEGTDDPEELPEIETLEGEDD